MYRSLRPKIIQSALIFIFLLSVAVYSQTSAQTSGDEELLQQGAMIYRENCAVCHGDEGQGRIGATLAKNWPSIRPEATVKTIIENGIPGSPMLAFSQENGGPLTSSEINTLVLYILSWQNGQSIALPELLEPTKRPPIMPIPEVDGDPNRGAVLFDQNCAVCHGADGKGRIGANLTKDWSGVRPDLSIRSTIVAGIPGSPMPAWGEANGGPLSDENIDDIVSFILSRTDQPSSQAVPTVIVNTPPQIPWLRSWGGVLVFVLLLVIIFGAAFYFQRKK